MTVLLFAQFGSQGGCMGVQATQLDFFLVTLKVPGMGSITPIVALQLQQLDFPAQRSQFGLFGRVGLAQIADFIAAGIQLGTQAFLGQLRHAQTLIEQCKLGVMGAGTALQLPDKRQQRYARYCQAKQQTAQIQSHKPSTRGKRARLTKRRRRRQFSLRSCSVPAAQDGHRHGQPDATIHGRFADHGRCRIRGTSIAPDGFERALRLGGQAVSANGRPRV